jgi:excisionase family DNA binding protein
LSKSPTVSRVRKALPLDATKPRALPQKSTKPLSARAVSELCGVELKTIHNWVAEGRLAHFRTPGRHLRFQYDEVMRFLQVCGQADPTQPTALGLLLAPTGQLGRALGSQMKGFTVERLTDAYEALVAAGRTAPRVIVAHASALTGVNIAKWASALRSRLPETRLILVDLKRSVGVGEPVPLKNVQAALALSGD